MEGDKGGSGPTRSGQCPNCGNYRIRIVIDTEGREVPVHCGQCGWRREE